MQRNKLVTLLLVVALALGGLGVWVGRTAFAQEQTKQAGWLGVAVRNTDAGVEIAEVTADSPAEAAGLTAGLIIKAVDDTQITSAAQLRDVLGSYAPETVVTLTVIEDEVERSVEVTLGARPAETLDLRPGRDDRDRPFLQARLSLLGLDLEMVAEGLQVNDIEPDSPLADAGLEVGDVITAINGESASDLLRGNLLWALRAKDPAEFTVQRGEETLTIEVDLSSLPALSFGMVEPSAGMPALRPTQLGVSFRTLTPAIAAEEGLPVDEGAQVVEVYEDTPAAKAGLQAGDIIVAVSGDVLDQERTLADRLYAYEEGDVVTLSVRRGEEELSLDVTLGPRNIGYGMGLSLGDLMPDMRDMPGMRDMPDMRDMPGMRGFRFGGPLDGMTPDDFLKQHPFLGDLFERLPDGTWRFRMPDLSAPEASSPAAPAVPGTNA